MNCLEIISLAGSLNISIRCYSVRCNVVIWYDSYIQHNCVQFIFKLYGSLKIDHHVYCRMNTVLHNVTIIIPNEATISLCTTNTNSTLIMRLAVCIKYSFVDVCIIVNVNAEQKYC